MNIDSIFTAKEIYDGIIRCLKDKTPYSLLRVGDGETIAMCPEKIEWQENYKRVCNNHLGHVLQYTEKIEIKEIIEDAIVNSNVLGLAPQKHREANEFWDAQHLLVNKIQLQHNIQTNNTKYCSLDIHLDLLQYGLLYKILAKINNVVIISSRDLKDDFLKRFPHLENIEYYLVPGEHIYEQTPSENTLYPTIYKNIIEKIYEKDRRGQICLFGAGFIGKGFGNHFKKAGGIAIDIGSVFDLWAGKRTRGEGKSNTAVNLNFILNPIKIKEIARGLRASKIKGHIIAQHKDFQKVFNPFLKLHKFTHILEIGTYRGGFTMYLKLRCPLNPKILSYDIEEQPEYAALRRESIDVKIKNIFDKTYSEVIDDYALNFLKEPGRKLILCDGGDKAAEFNCLSNYLNPGDFIMAHDYCLSEKYFKDVVQGNIWNSCEIIEEDIFHSSVRNKLLHYNFNDFQQIAWLCKTKLK